MYQSIFTAKVSYLPRVDGADDELKTISLGRALIADTWRAQVEAVRAETDPAKQEALKKALPCFTPSGTFSHISRTGLKQHSGFISIDIDCKPDKGINPALVGFDLKAAVAAVPHIAYCGRSCRGAGYVVVIPIADPTKHSEYFRALGYESKHLGIDLGYCWTKDGGKTYAIIEMDLFDVQDQVIQNLEGKRTLDYSHYEDMVVGLPFNLRFILK